MAKTATAERDVFIGARASTDERMKMERVMLKMNIKNTSSLIRTLVNEKATELMVG